MKVKVTEQGVVIPKELLEGAEEVEICQENGFILIKPTLKSDLILELGKNLVGGGVTDASQKHDDRNQNYLEHQNKNDTSDANPDPLADFIGAVYHGALAQNTDRELYES